MMKTITKSIVCIVFMIFVGQAVNAQSIKGKVSDATSGEALIGANVAVLNLSGGMVTGATTDVNGNYSIDNVASGSYLIKAIYVGYADQAKSIMVNEDMTLDFALTESASRLDAVVISAGRKAEKVSEASANIQIIDSKEIAVAQEPTTYGLLKNVTGVDYVETGLGQQQVNARGFASPFTGGMLTLVDYRSVTLPGIGGVFGPSMGVNQNDIKQIEVIVGPNSALYGANASQGVINIITKNPKENPGNSITIRGGNRSQLGLGFRSAGLLGDKFGYKISGERFSAKDFDQTVELISQGQPTGVFTNPDNDISNQAVNGSLYFFPSDNVELVYTGGISKANYVNQSNIGPLQVKNFTFWYHQLRANFNNFFNLGSAFFQVNYTADDAKDTYNLERVAGSIALGASEADAIKMHTFIDKPSRVDMEFQHNFDIDEKNAVTWGTQYRNTQPNSEGTFLNDGPSGEQIIINEFGAYLQYENQMINNVKLTLSGRFDNNDVFGSQFSPKAALSYHKNNQNFRVVYNQAFASPPIQPAFALTPITSLQTANTTIVPGVELLSVPVNMVLRGAKDGFTVNDAAGNVVGSVPALSPVLTESIELGYKGLLFNKLYLDFTYYNTTYSDFLSAPIPINNPELIFDGAPIGAGDINAGIGWTQLAFGDPTAAPSPITYVEGFGTELVLSYINFGEVNVQGLDLAADYQINNNFSINVAYSFADYGDFKDVPLIISSTGTPNSPENVWRGGIKYTNKSGAYAELNFRSVEGYFFTAAREYQTGLIPSFTVFSLKGEVPVNIFESFKTTFGASINNLFNNLHIELPGTPELGILASAYLRIDFGGN